MLQLAGTASGCSFDLTPHFDVIALLLHDPIAVTHECMAIPPFKSQAMMMPSFSKLRKIVFSAPELDIK